MVISQRSLVVAGQGGTRTQFSAQYSMPGERRIDTLPQQLARCHGHGLGLLCNPADAHSWKRPGTGWTPA